MKNQKTQRGRSPELSKREATQAVTPERFVPDATWHDIAHLDLDGNYTSFRPPRKFVDAMVADAKHWAETEDRSVIWTVASAVAKVVMPMILDFQQWRMHINNHLRRLCGSRRLFMSETQEFVTQLGERCSDLEEQISQFARIVPQLQERCNDLDERTYSLRSKIERLESEVQRLESPAGFDLSASSQRSAATVRERSNDRSRDHAASSECPRGRQESDPLDVVFEGKLNAIRARSKSPAADKAQAFLEYSQRKLAQLSQQAAEEKADRNPV